MAAVCAHIAVLKVAVVGGSNSLLRVTICRRDGAVVRCLIFGQDTLLIAARVLVGMSVTRGLIVVIATRATIPCHQAKPKELNVPTGQLKRW